VGGTIQTEPSVMNAPTRDESTTDEEIVINWLPLYSPQNGDSPITSYNL